MALSFFNISSEISERIDMKDGGNLSQCINALLAKEISPKKDDLFAE